MVQPVSATLIPAACSARPRWPSAIAVTWRGLPAAAVMGQLLAGVLLGLVSGLLTGMVASFASSQMARGPLSDFRGSGSRQYG